MIDLREISKEPKFLTWYGFESREEKTGGSGMKNPFSQVVWLNGGELDSSHGSIPCPILPYVPQLFRRGNRGAGRWEVPTHQWSLCRLRI